MRPYKHNLPPEYELVYQFTVHQVGKRSKIIMSNNLSLTTLNSDKVRSNVSVQRQLTGWVLVNALVHIVPICEKEQNMSNNILLTILYPDKVQSNASDPNLVYYKSVNCGFVFARACFTFQVCWFSDIHLSVFVLTNKPPQYYQFVTTVVWLLFSAVVVIMFSGGMVELTEVLTDYWELQMNSFSSTVFHSFLAWGCENNYRISANRRRGVYLFRWSVWCAALE